jgi:hypothetical protein
LNITDRTEQSRAEQNRPEEKRREENRPEEITRRLPEDEPADR